MRRMRTARILSMVLSAALVFSSTGMSVLAAGVDENLVVREEINEDGIGELNPSSEEDKPVGNIIVEEETSNPDMANEPIEDELNGEAVIEDKTEGEVESVSDEASEPTDQALSEELEEELVEDTVLEESTQEETAEEETEVEELGDSETSAQYLNISSTGVLSGLNDEGKALESIELVIPKNVVSISDRAFSKNTKIKSVKFEEGSQLDSIGEAAFEGCSAITEFDIPDTVRTIKYEALGGTGISEVVLPSNLVDLGARAFQKCTSLSKVTLLSNTVKSGTNANAFGIFPECEISNITFGDKVDHIPDYLFCYAGITAGTEVIIPEKVTAIGKGAFYSTNVAKVTFKEGSVLDSIGESAFRECSAITEFDIPDTVCTIGHAAFWKTGISKIVLPSTLVDLGERAFNECTNLSEVTLLSNKLVTGTNANAFGIFPGCAISRITFGSNIDHIPDYLFCYAGMAAGTEVVIPKKVTAIGKGAFCSTNVAKITFEEGSVLDSIGDSAFRECSAITEFDIPDTVRTIGYAAFWKTGISKIVLPSTLVGLGERAFNECTSLSEVTLLSNKLVTGTNANYFGIFPGCAISRITFGPKVNAIPNYLFYNAGFSGAANIDIPATITSIGNGNFASCSPWMRTVTISASVKSIAADAFKGCDSYVTFKVTDGSYAHKWATDHSYNVETVLSISYNLNGGEYVFSGSYPTSYISGTTTMLEISPASRKGYIFDGWFLNKELNKAFTGTDNRYDFTGKTGSVLLYAKWTPTTYTVTFDENKPAGAVDKTSTSTFADISATYDKIITVPTNKNTITKYVFDGWNTKADGTGTNYKAGAKVKNLTADGDTIKLYGKWKVCTYSVKYDSNASGISSKVSGKMKNTVLTFGVSENGLSKNTYNANGYTFAGWTTRADGKGIVFTDEQKIGTALETYYAKDSNQVVTLYAQWNQIPYKVSLYKNDGVTEKIATIPVEYGQKLSDAIEIASVSDLLVRNGYILSSWNTQANGKGRKYTLAATNITALGDEVNLYAQWTGPISYKVTYVLNGGKNNSKNPKKYAVNSSEITLINPTKTGYTFEGWKIVSGDVNGAAVGTTISTIPTGSYNNLTLSAQWAENHYKVVFHGADDRYTEVADTVEMVVGYTDIIDLYTPALHYATRTGVEGKVGISAWTTAENGRGKSYVIGKNISKLSADNFDVAPGKGVINLYAKWGTQTYRINYVLNDGINNKSNPQVYTYNPNKAVTIKAPSKPGYVFVGWNVNDSSEVIDKYVVEKGASGEIKLTANWKAVKYTVALNLNSKTAKAADGFALSYQTSSDGTGEGVTNAVVLSDNGDMLIYNSGYEFTGFNTKSNGKGIAANISEEKVLSLNGLTTATAEKNSGIKVTLYAQWKPIQYNINYINIDPDDSDDVLARVNNRNKTTYNVTNTISLSNPSKAGFVFEGWYTDRECTQKVKKINKGTTGDIILYGKWRIK